jgi:hypothetical protein
MKKFTNQDLDLDIHNYELDDILNLFKIPKNFNETHLKQAKQIVLKTHPDKSGLDSCYFLFYSKAYKVLYNVWDFQKKSNVNKINTETTDYKVLRIDEKEKKKILDNFFKTELHGEDFNVWFNNQFERNKINYENDIKGYGEWLKSEEEGHNSLNDTNQSMNMYEMKEAFDKRKSQARTQALTVKKDICELYSPTQYASDLCGKVEDFNSDIFSNLKYQDLYEAHTNSVIPVSDEDFNLLQKFSTVDEYRAYRSSQDIKPISGNQALQIINNKNMQDENKSMSRAFELAKQSELAQKKNNDFWSNILCLENKNL